VTTLGFNFSGNSSNFSDSAFGFFHAVICTRYFQPSTGHIHPAQHPLIDKNIFIEQYITRSKVAINNIILISKGKAYANISKRS